MMAISYRKWKWPKKVFSTKRFIFCKETNKEKQLQQMRSDGINSRAAQMLRIQITLCIKDRKMETAAFHKRYHFYSNNL